jgi:hypothetical protein
MTHPHAGTVLPRVHVARRSRVDEPARQVRSVTERGTNVGGMLLALNAWLV